MSKERLRLATLISGGGTTMEQIVRACQSGEIPMNMSCVISSNPDAGGIRKARALGISVDVINPNDFKGEDGKVDQESFGLALRGLLRAHKVDVVTQNGWMPLTPELVIDEYKDTIFNQHPGPVPEFGGKGMYGRRVHAAVLIYRRVKEGTDLWTEVVAQRVAKKYDEGAVLRSERIKIEPQYTIDDLQQAALPLEHFNQIAFLKNLATGNIREVQRASFNPDDKHIIFEAKKTARLLYPNG